MEEFLEKKMNNLIYKYSLLQNKKKQGKKFG